MSSSSESNIQNTLNIKTGKPFTIYWQCLFQFCWLAKLAYIYSKYYRNFQGLDNLPKKSLTQPKGILLDATQLNELFLTFRIQQLTQLYEDVRGTLESKEIDLKLELEARINREMQIKELEDTLAKETDHAQDLKVGITKLLFFSRLFQSLRWDRKIYSLPLVKYSTPLFVNQPRHCD